MNKLLRDKWFRGSYVVTFFCFLLLETSCGSSTYVVKEIKGELVEINSGLDASPDKNTTSILLPYKQKKDSLMEMIIGYSEIEMLSYRPESPLSNFAADVLKEQAAAYTDKNIDVAITNMGGLRNSLPKGNITVGTIFEIFPFENHLCLLTMNGNTLRKLLGQIAYLRGEGISGVQMRVAKDGTIEEVTVNGKVIDPLKSYTVATLDYLSEGNDGMTAFLEAKEKKCFVEATIRKMMLDYIIDSTKAGKTLTSSVDGRIKIDE